MPPREILRTPYIVMRYDPALRLVRLWRSSEVFSSIEEVRTGWQSAVDACDRLGRAGRCFLADVRDGPARNDPAFEKVVLELVPKLHTGFLRNAVLVRLAIGALQISRLARNDRVERLITSSEEEALAYLREPFEKK